MIAAAAAAFTTESTNALAISPGVAHEQAVASEVLMIAAAAASTTESTNALAISRGRPPPLKPTTESPLSP